MPPNLKQDPESLWLQAQVHRALIAHCLRNPAYETCALLGGRERLATRFYPVANIAPRPRRRYEMDPAQQIAAMARMRADGEQLLAIAHSHPESTAEPSPTDVDQASYPEAVYVIVSLLNPEQPVTKGFRLSPGRPPDAVALHLL